MDAQLWENCGQNILGRGNFFYFIYSINGAVKQPSAKEMPSQRGTKKKEKKKGKRKEKKG